MRYAVTLGTVRENPCYVCQVLLQLGRQNCPDNPCGLVTYLLASKSPSSPFPFTPFCAHLSRSHPELQKEGLHAIATPEGFHCFHETPVVVVNGTDGRFPFLFGAPNRHKRFNDTFLESKSVQS